MNNASTAAYDERVNRSANVRRYEKALHLKIIDIFRSQEKRADNIIRDSSLTVAGKRKLKRELRASINKAKDEAFRTSKLGLIDLIGDQLSFGFQNMDNTIGKIWRTKRPPRRIAEEIVLKRPLHADKTLLQGWANISLGERKRIEKTIRQGLAKGLSPEELALSVRKGNVHRITRNQSRTLVTTAITSVYSQADQAIYKANENALTGWQYVAVLDASTTPVCSHRDGQVFDVDNVDMLPPAHYFCRSTTTPVFKSWKDIKNLDNLNQVRQRNLAKLSPQQIAFYDGKTPLKENYSEWLLRQSYETQLKHLGSDGKVNLFQRNKLPLSKFGDIAGNPLTLQSLRRLTDEYTPPGQTAKFATAKQKLDDLSLAISVPEDITEAMKKSIVQYYILQANELDGNLSMMGYRGITMQAKKAKKRSVLNRPPNESELVYSPVLRRYVDSRLYQPEPKVLETSLRLLDDSPDLNPTDKAVIGDIVNRLEASMSVNQRAVVADNLRILFTRYRKNPEPWNNFKAVVNAQIKFDILNVSDNLETALRSNSSVLKKLKQEGYIDPVLGISSLDELHDNLISNIKAKLNWERTVAPKLAKELRQAFDLSIPIPLRRRITDPNALNKFYVKFAHRLSLAASPDIDEFAVALGRDLYTLANLNGTKDKWRSLGMNLLNANNDFFKLETFGVQKRRMRSSISGQFFGQFYDTFSQNIIVTDPRIKVYERLSRQVDVGMRVPMKHNKLVIRRNSKEYWIDDGVRGYKNTGIPITSTSSYSDFPEELIDQDFVDALNWSGKTRYTIDPDTFDFSEALLMFKDDKGRSKYFDELNEYRQYMSGRDDTYERFTAMRWLRKSNSQFGNMPFVDHRGRVYERGLISPQSGESYRGFLSTAEVGTLGQNGYRLLNDQVGGFLGGISDRLEGRYNALSFTGRQKITEMHRKALIEIGHMALRRKPNDIRKFLQHPLVAQIEGEELNKFVRFAIEYARLDNYLGGDFSDLRKLDNYKTTFAMEVDASSSGAQIIALTTKNKQLAQYSNVVPTEQKNRLYDIVARDTFNDPRFKKLNAELNLTEKDLRKAAKYKVMVSLYGAGEKTGLMQIEKNLAKILGKKDILTVTSTDRSKVLDQISARAAKYKQFSPETYQDLMTLRKQVKDVMDNGRKFEDSIIKHLWFIDDEAKGLINKITAGYDNSQLMTPKDFLEIGKIMSEYSAAQAPILKSFTRYFGRLAEDFLKNSKPSAATIDWKSVVKMNFLGKNANRGQMLPEKVANFLGLDPTKPVTKEILERYLEKDHPLMDLLYGVKSPQYRQTGRGFAGFSLDFGKKIGKVPVLKEFEFLETNKLPKSWTSVPSVNMDGKVIEQVFRQTFEEKLNYFDKDGKRITNIINVSQKTEASFLDVLFNRSGKINDIADVIDARTAYGVNFNHSNDSVMVRRFHLWGSKNKVPTSTIHDAFMTNIAELPTAMKALRKIYADFLENNVILMTLNEMKARGLPLSVYNQYLNEAIDIGLIPVPGRSVIDGKVVTLADILTEEDILESISTDFTEDYGWYGIGI